MSGTIDLATAQRVLGRDVLGPDEVGAAFGGGPAIPPIPYSVAELEAAVPAGECLVLRAERDSHGPLTLLRLIERFPDAFDQRLLRTMGYQLKDDWGIELEPRAATDVCVAGWILVRKQILDASRNQPYVEQISALARYATQLGVPPSRVRRRSAVEIAYDLILYRAARGERLLADTWDWSNSLTVDAGYLNIGGFGKDGMQILSYSPAVRHGALGVCPARLPHG
ncbi:MAG TPA: hypothetical protein VL403_01705 [Candidatus Kryptonia bacterium]|nr:hypothetical protein [Candidatus Kryptonia bacterium]